MSDVAQRIAKLLEQEGLSYRELANRAKIPSSTLQRYATGVTDKIPQSRINAIAAALHTTPAYLCGYTDNPEPGIAFHAISALSPKLLALEESMDKAINEIVGVIYEICGINEENYVTNNIEAVLSPSKISVLKDFLRDHKETFKLLVESIDDPNSLITASKASQILFGTDENGAERDSTDSRLDLAMVALTLKQLLDDASLTDAHELTNAVECFFMSGGNTEFLRTYAKASHDMQKAALAVLKSSIPQEENEKS